MRAPQPMTAASTTTRYCWAIDKFSTAESTSTGGTKDSLQWDHRAQKQHYLELETIATCTQAHAASFNSMMAPHSSLPQHMYLRILFDPLFDSQYPSSSSSVPRAPVILDSVDLVSFSSTEVQSRCAEIGRMPIKAAYRDHTAALSYVQVEAAQSSIQSPFRTRRLQVTFQTLEAREQFVNAVSSVITFKREEKKGEQHFVGSQQSRSRQSASMSSFVPLVPPVSQGLFRPSSSSTAAVASQPPTCTTIPRPKNVTEHQQVMTRLAQHFPETTAVSGPTSPSPLPPSSSSATLEPSTAHELKNLTSLTEYEFDKLLLATLMEPDFEELVDRVKSSLGRVNATI
ncbi:hypothetical protein OIO90_003663 [Microbotryomycetes sp. JL221]|nr:hypothetical protein OIO90_003663 [Microbotryomycetes sp. JL221]